MTPFYPTYSANCKLIPCQLETTSDHTPLSKGDLIIMAMENEKRVGVNSGGYVSTPFLPILIPCT